MWGEIAAQMTRILLVGALIVAALALGKQEHVFARAGIVHTCSAIPAPIGEDGHWVACEEGWLDGYPDLSIDSCERASRSPAREYWRCPVELSTSFKP
jgi:hypothetical protein